MRDIQFLFLTIYTLKSGCIFSILFSIHFLKCWREEFVWQSRTSLVGDHFLYSRDPHGWFRGDIVRRNYMLVTLRGQIVQRGHCRVTKKNCSYFDIGGVRNLNIDCMVLKQLRGNGRNAPWRWSRSVHRAVYRLTWQYKDFNQLFIHLFALSRQADPFQRKSWFELVACIDNNKAKTQH